jgi:MFS family permease
MTLATGLPAAYFIKDRRPANRHIKLIDWTLFNDPKFVYMFISGVIATFPLFVPPFFIPLYAGSVGLSASTGAALLAGFNLASAVGRISFGLVCDSLGAVHALLISLFLSAISMLAIWPVSQEIGPLTVFVIVGGLANGGFFSTIPTAVGSVFGTTKITVAMGMIATGWGGGYLMGGPIAGYLLAAFGGEQAGFQAYRPAMYYSGAMSMLAAALVLMLRLRIGRRLKMKI